MSFCVTIVPSKLVLNLFYPKAQERSTMLTDDNIHVKFVFLHFKQFLILNIFVQQHLAKCKFGYPGKGICFLYINLPFLKICASQCYNSQNELQRI